MQGIGLANHISWQMIPNHEFAYVFNILDKQYYVFEDTELDIWNCIAKHEGLTIDELVDNVAKIYEMNSDEIRDDIIEFVDGLFDIGVIEHYGSSEY